jgi:hypothetical protein
MPQCNGFHRLFEPRGRKAGTGKPELRYADIEMPPSAVQTLIHSAWRRRLVVLTTEQLAFALLLTSGGAILMLLTGTQILDWYWLVLLAAIGLGVSGWRIRRRLVHRYDLARLIDDRLQLQDSLSTAWFLLSEPSNRDRPIARRQIEGAEQLAATIAPESAFPIVLSRLWIASFALIVVIFGLFTTRYLLNSSLSLKPALIHLPFASDKAAAAEAKLREQPKNKTDGQGQPARELLPGDQRNTAAPSASPSEAAPNAQSDSKSQQNANASSSSSSGKSSESSQPEDGQSASKNGEQNAESSGSENPKPDSKAAQNSKDANGSRQDKGRAQPKSADGQQTPGLMDKMKDAISGLMAKLQRPSASDNGSRDAKKNASGQKSQGQQNAAKDKQNGTPDQNGQKAQSSLDSPSSAQAAAVEKTPASALGSSNEQMQQSKSNDPQSGAGRQDGQKDLKDAEQLRAMGKLAEIIGKRSANLTGDIKVEKPTQQQQLETQYTNRVGQHVDNGGEINRDEVPSEYQNYVRAYMSEVHKQANANK